MTKYQRPMRYRKKPIVIEAAQIDLDKKHNIPEEFRERLCNCEKIGGGYEPEPGRTVYPWHVHTLEGPLKVSDQDYLIKGISGEFYPCKPDIFEKTYEKVED